MKKKLIHLFWLIPLLLILANVAMLYIRFSGHGSTGTGYQEYDTLFQGKGEFRDGISGRDDTRVIGIVTERPGGVEECIRILKEHAVKNGWPPRDDGDDDKAQYEGVYPKDEAYQDDFRRGARELARHSALSGPIRDRLKAWGSDSSLKTRSYFVRNGINMYGFKDVGGGRVAIVILENDS